MLWGWSRAPTEVLDYGLGAILRVTQLFRRSMFTAMYFSH